MNKGTKQRGGVLPQIPIAPNDLRVLEDILNGYIAYVRNNGQLSSKSGKKIQGLEDIQARIVFLRHSGEGGAATLSIDDIEAIRQAMFDFVQIIRRTVPQSSERDETLKLVNLLRRHLEEAVTPKKGKKGVR